MSDRSTTIQPWDCQHSRIFSSGIRKFSKKRSGAVCATLAVSIKCIVILIVESLEFP